MTHAASSKTLSELIGSHGTLLQGSWETMLSSVEHDSRRTQKDGLFIALSGENHDGRDFIASAVQRGAAAIILERPVEKIPSSVAVVKVPDARAVLAPVAVKFYEDPSSRLRVVGVTGTNGKTSTTYLLESLLNSAGFHCGVMGTIEYRLGKEREEAPNTTPDPLTLQRFLRRAVDEDFTHVAMEVSSHALALGRVEGVKFSSCVFTNLTQEHLDFHKDMETYFSEKRKLFERTQRAGGLWGAVNIDDPYGARLAADFAAQIVAYGFSESAALRALDLSLSLKGTEFTLLYGSERAKVHLSLLGAPSAANALAAAAIGVIEGLPLGRIAEGLSIARRPPGRFEVVDAGQDFTVIVDYAHTPDALERLLQMSRTLKPKRLITVFGCGGDRDRTKRAPMGEIAARLSDLVFVTSDNSRTERPESIVDEILLGIRNGVEAKRVMDRREAIGEALHQARRGDLVVVAGKGHEDYQIIGTEKSHFDDREEILSALHDLGWR